jgi:predicted nucleic acid-binding protein
VVSWFTRQDPATLFLTSISLGEMDLGAHGCREPTRRERLLAWCDMLEDVMFKNRILAFDARCARAWGRLGLTAREQRRTIEWRDSQIASIAVCLGARIATRNVRHFRGLGIDLLNPFETDAPPT